MPYNHLNARERTILFHMNQYGFSLRKIGRHLNRSHTTLSRELNRNTRPFGQCYCDRYATYKADQRRHQPRHQLAYNNQPLREYVDTKLVLGWSPELIAGRIQIEYPRARGMRITHEAIYQWLYKDADIGGQNIPVPGAFASQTTETTPISALPGSYRQSYRH